MKVQESCNHAGKHAMFTITQLQESCNHAGKHVISTITQLQDHVIMQVNM